MNEPLLFWCPSPFARKTAMTDNARHEKKPLLHAANTAWHDECPPPSSFPAQILTQIPNAANRHPPSSAVDDWSKRPLFLDVFYRFFKTWRILNARRIQSSFDFGFVIFQQACLCLLFGHVRFGAASRHRHSWISPSRIQIATQVQIWVIGGSSSRTRAGGQMFAVLPLMRNSMPHMTHPNRAHDAKLNQTLIHLP